MLVQLVSTRPGGAAVAWRRLPRRIRHGIRLRQHDRVPAGGWGAAVVVLDLTAPPPGLLPRSFPDAGGARYVVLVGGSPVPADWLTFVQRPDVEVVQAVGDHDPLEALAQALTGRATGLLPRSLTEAVIAAAPKLAPLADLVLAVLRQPRRIRRPRDLAVALGLSRRALARRGHEAKVVRVDHAITATRWVAWQQLLWQFRFTADEARRLMGVEDAANFLRQIRRATYLLQ